ncbi:hypothetical protein CLOP_g14550 [Closterium sp. NIES-67]|nr:hypothetical protein CLOP_g14550 [Closterium sp. NIES-67]
MCMASHQISMTSHQISITSHQISMTSHQISLASHQISMTSHQISMTSHQISMTTHQISMTSHQISMTSHQISMMVHQISMTSHQISMASHQISMTSHQISMTSHQISMTSHLLMKVGRQVEAAAGMCVHQPDAATPAARLTRRICGSTCEEQHREIAACLLEVNAMGDWLDCDECRPLAFGFHVVRSMPREAESQALRNTFFLMEHCSTSQCVPRNPWRGFTGPMGSSHVDVVIDVPLHVRSLVPALGCHVQATLEVASSGMDLTDGGSGSKDTAPLLPHSLSHKRARTEQHPSQIHAGQVGVWAGNCNGKRGFYLV